MPTLRKNPRHRAAVLTVLTLSVAARGDDDPLSTAEFVMQGNVICKAGEDKIEGAAAKAFPNENERPDLERTATLRVRQQPRAPSRCRNTIPRGALPGKRRRTVLRGRLGAGRRSHRHWNRRRHRAALGRNHSGTRGAGGQAEPDPRPGPGLQPRRDRPVRRQRPSDDLVARYRLLAWRRLRYCRSRAETQPATGPPARRGPRHHCWWDGHLRASERRPPTPRAGDPSLLRWGQADGSWRGGRRSARS